MENDRIADALLAIASALERFADALAGRQEESPRAVKGLLQETAQQWLIARFREQREWPSSDLFHAAAQERISRNAIYEAKTSLGIPKARKVTDAAGTRWVWWVPSDWPHLAEE